MLERRNFDPSVYFILDPSACGGRDPYEVARAAIKGGITMLQLRDKNPDLVRTPELARKLVALTRGTSIAFIINDDVALARAVDADGVHLGQGDMTPSEARQILGERVIVGQTAFEERHFTSLGKGTNVDYLGTGPVYPTLTKPDKKVFSDLGDFSAMISLTPQRRISVVGIGGITPQNAPAVMSAGADGVAMIRAIGEAKDPEAAARQFVLNLAIRNLDYGFQMASSMG